MSVVPFILTRPAYTVISSVIQSVETVPRDDPDAAPSLRGFLGFIFPVTILIDALIDEVEEGRSLGEEQYGVYRSIEHRLSTDYGMDGRTCILRFICELQRRPISQWTAIGQLITTLFTPSLGRKKKDLELLVEYRGAQKVGLKEELACGDIYKRCPFSVFGYFDALRNVTSVQTRGKISNYLWK